MVCEKCKHIICLQAFSTGKCKICNCNVTTPHIPSYKVCDKHSEEYNLCQQCGKPIKKED